MTLFRERVIIDVRPLLRLRGQGDADTSDLGRAANCMTHTCRMPWVASRSRVQGYGVGMHHLTDVVGGAIDGLACAELAAGCLVHRCGDKTDAPIRLANIAEPVPSARP